MKLKELEEPEYQVRFHRYLKWFWFLVALFSLTPLGDWLRNSIAVIFFVSVYANYISHWSTERALEAQLEARK